MIYLILGRKPVAIAKHPLKREQNPIASRY